ncbi:MAG TPA: hypothetical protein PLD54_02335 [Candidatus Levybacteria bacterium]|nr:hypothetical protein [Candidatus Levybacteria bacterium]
MKKLFLLGIPSAYLLVLLLRAEQAFTQDLGRHLILGEMILDCLCVPKTNTFSYTAPNFPFINHHWLPEVIFYLIVKVSGLYTLLGFKIMMIVLSLLPVLYVAIKRGGIALSTTVLIPLIFIFSERFDARPEIFSFVYLSLFMMFCFQYLKTKQYVYLLPLPLIQLLWVNSHIYFFIGILLYLFLFFDQVYKKSVKKQLVVIGILIAGATLLNPHGVVGALYPLRVFGNYGYSIVENQNIFFLNGFFFNPRILVFEVMAIVGAIALFVHIKKRNIFDVLCLLFAIVAGGVMIRNFPLFVLIAFPSIVAAFALVIGRYNTKTRKNIAVWTITGAFLFTLVTSLQMITSPLFGLRYVYGAEKAVDFFEKNNVPGNIFNNFDIGSYLIYRLYPAQKVFVDGRPEAYPADFFEVYKKMQTDPELFEQQVIRYDISTIFFAHTDITPWAQQFLQTIVRDPAWVVIYLDERIIILVRDSPENSALIKQYKVQL